ncbi:MAG TPA: DUF3000 domain-containing protein [Frankiaceae bacterium]|jgi:hypothetical protein|nr:DUF3000 domain-containing protein [Frankiaceae bacterium]
MEQDAGPEAFRRVVASLRDALTANDDPAVELHETAAPSRLAPYAFALTAEVVSGEEELSAGRFIVLHDPNGQEAWDGETRVVAFATAAVEEEIGRDPLLPEVGWTWLLDALHARGVTYRAEGGTVTSTTSMRFGAMAGEAGTCDLELRCSWTPGDDDDLAAHLSAFCDVLCSMGGLPPAQPGVVRLPLRRHAG